MGTAREVFPELAVSPNRYPKIAIGVTKDRDGFHLSERWKRQCGGPRFAGGPPSPRLTLCSQSVSQKHALYQGTTSVVLKSGRITSGFNPCGMADPIAATFSGSCSDAGPHHRPLSQPGGLERQPRCGPVIRLSIDVRRNGRAGERCRSHRNIPSIEHDQRILSVEVF